MFLLTRAIAAVLPPRLWYRVSFLLSTWQARVLSPLLVLSPLRKDYRRPVLVACMVQSFLVRLTARGRPFPIPTRSGNLKSLLDAMKNPRGAVLCAAHQPLVWLGLRHLVELGLPPTAVLVGASNKDNQVSVWGMEEHVPALVIDAHVLLKTRQILRQGGQVATLIDASVGYPLNRNMLRFIRLTGADLVFGTTELQSNGEIVVECFAPPEPLCTTDEAIGANLRAFQDQVFRVLKQHGAVAAPALPLNKGVSRSEVA